MPLAIFPAHVSKILRLPRKSDTNSYEVLHLSRKIISANLKIWCSKMQPLSGNQRPDLRTALMNKSLVLRLPRERHLARSMSQACHRFRTCYKTITFCSLLTRCIIPCACHAKRHLNVQKCSEPLVFLHFWLRNVLRAATTCTFSTSQLPKHDVFCAFWLGSLLRATTTCTFFDITTSKSGPNMVLCTFWLGNALRATTACNFSSLNRIRRFSEPTFRPSGATNHWKNAVFRNFPTFSRTWISFLIFFLLLFSSLSLPISAFHLSILSEVWLLNFLRSYCVYFIYIYIYICVCVC